MHLFPSVFLKMQIQETRFRKKRADFPKSFSVLTKIEKTEKTEVVRAYRISNSSLAPFCYILLISKNTLTCTKKVVDKNCLLLYNSLLRRNGFGQLCLFLLTEKNFYGK